MSRKRAAHGALAATGVTSTWESTPSDEVRAAPVGSAAPVDRREDGTVTPAGAAELARRRWEAARMPDFGDKAAPWMPPSAELAPFDGARKDLLMQRRDELATMTGAVSSGVGAKLRGWAYVHAAGEYWGAQFFATGDAKAYHNMVGAFRAASVLEDQARDAAAWEAQARRNAPIDPAREAREIAEYERGCAELAARHHPRPRDDGGTR